MLIRILSLFLLLAMLFGCISCSHEEKADPSLTLEILSPDVSYSDSFKKEASSRFASVLEGTVKLYRGIDTPKEKKSAWALTFEKEILALFREIKASEKEILSLLSACEEALAGVQENSTAMTPLYLFYQKASYLFGTVRAGKFFYRASLAYLADSAEESRARYEKYGYPFFLEDALRAESLADALASSLGEEGFCTASAITSFALSVLFEGITPKADGEGILPFGDADFLYILAYQGRSFEKQAISAEGWRAFAALLSEFLPENQNSLLESELYALKKEAYFERAAAAFPALVTLYASVTAKLHEDGLWSGEGTQSANERAICLALLDGTFPLDDCLFSVEETLKSASDAEASALAACAAQEAFSAFLAKNPPLSRDALIDGLRAIANGQGDGASLSSLFLGYAVGQMPYLAFALYGSN